MLVFNRRVLFQVASLKRPILNKRMYAFHIYATSPPLQWGLSVCGFKVKDNYWIGEILLREICIFLIVWAHKKENLHGIWDSTEAFCLICCVCLATQRAPFRKAERRQSLHLWVLVLTVFGHEHSFLMGIFGYLRDLHYLCSGKST